jgi:MFS family permease
MTQRHVRNPYLRQLVRDPLILPFYVPSFVIFLGFGLLTPVLPLYAGELGRSYAWVGAITSAQALGMLVTDIPCGLLLRRLGQKRAVLLGMALTILLRIAMSWAGSVYEAFAYQFISGFGIALYGVARHAYITEHAPIANRGKSMALFGGLNRVGGFIGPLIGGYVADALGLRVPFIVSGLVALPAIAAVALTMPQDGGDRMQAPAGRRLPNTVGRLGFGRLGALLRDQAALLIPAGLGHIFVQTIRSGRGTIIPLYGARMINLDVGEVGLLIGIAAALEMVMFLPAGWLMDNMGRKYAYLPSFGLQAIGMACVPLTGGFAGLLACTSLIGIGNGLSSGGMMTLGSDLAPEDARAEFLGVWRLIGDVGGTTGPAAVGFVADALALPAAALTLAASGVLACFTFGLGLPETLNRDGEARELRVVQSG